VIFSIRFIVTRAATKARVDLGPMHLAISLWHGLPALVVMTNKHCWWFQKGHKLHPKGRIIA